MQDTNNTEKSFKTSIQIKWSIPRPTFVPPARMIEWPANIHLNLPSEKSEIERKLGIHAGTLSVLTEAFTNGYKRSEGWTIRSTSTLALNALHDAARLFKRGVSFNSPDSIEREFGEYKIDISKTVDLEEINDSGAMVLVDKNVRKHWSNEFQTLKNVIEFEASEKKKTLDTCANLCGSIDQIKPGHIYIVGGGISGDMAAFAAYLKGVPFTLVPTTLLAMVDACVGGKTGVNFPPYGKNQIGSFAFPKRVLVFTDWLRTLPEEQIRAGLSECVKHALICGDELLFKDLCNISRKQEYSRIIEKLEGIIRVKADVISRDPEEKGERAILNLGHTLAHALEALSQYSHTLEDILHGEAVALGLLFVSVLSFEQKTLSKRRFEEIKNSLLQSKLLPNLERQQKFFESQFSFEDIAKYIEMDKKNTAISNQKSRWVLLSDNGVDTRNGYTSELDYMEINKAYRIYTEFLKDL